MCGGGGRWEVGKRGIEQCYSLNKNCTLTGIYLIVFCMLCCIICDKPQCYHQILW